MKEQLSALMDDQGDRAEGIQHRGRAEAPAEGQERQPEGDRDQSDYDEASATPAVRQVSKQRVQDRRRHGRNAEYQTNPRGPQLKLAG